ncbi:MAG: NAD-dependent epimerase/dehydratase family protein [Kofleriaceae bacterium]
MKKPILDVESYVICWISRIPPRVVLVDVIVVHVRVNEWKFDSTPYTTGADGLGIRSRLAKSVDALPAQGAVNAIPSNGRISTEATPMRDTPTITQRGIGGAESIVSRTSPSMMSPSPGVVRTENPHALHTTSAIKPPSLEPTRSTRFDATTAASHDRARVGAMRVLVTGAAGFIGSHTVERLVAAGHAVVGLDAFDSYLYPASIKRATASAITHAAFRLVEGDICDAATIASVLTEDVDVVCHLAALAGVRPSLEDPQRYLRTNIVGTGVILERMRALGKKRLVFASSSSVYGKRPATSDAFREDDPCLSPASPYAATKRMNELQLSAYRDLWGLGVFALRFFTVYGPRQRTDMAIARFLAAVSAGTPITMFGDGTTRRDYTFIDDIVAGVVAAIERIVPGAFQLINLGNTQTIALRELITVIERVVGRSAIIESVPEQPGDVPLTFANIDRARSLLDYQPTTRIEEGVSRQWSYMGQVGL